MSSNTKTTVIYIPGELDTIVGVGGTAEEAWDDARSEAHRAGLDLSNAQERSCTPHFADHVRTAGQPREWVTDAEGRWDIPAV